MATGGQWYFQLKGEREGPLSLAEISSLVKERTIQESTLVWHIGMKEWLPAEEVRELFPAHRSSAADAGRSNPPPSATAMNASGAPTPPIPAEPVANQHSPHQQPATDQLSQTAPMNTCPDCSGAVSSRATSCPHCGCPLSDSPHVGQVGMPPTGLQAAPSIPAVPTLGPTVFPPNQPAPGPVGPAQFTGMSPASQPAQPSFPQHGGPISFHDNHLQAGPDPFGNQANMGYRTHGKSYDALATQAMVCAIAGLILFGFILGLIALILAINALNGMKASGNEEGHGKAMAGLILGIVDLVGWFFIILAML